jgi:hypothetical protein
MEIEAPHSLPPVTRARPRSNSPSDRDPIPACERLRSLSIFLASDRGLAIFLGFLVLNTIVLPMFNLSRTGRLMVLLAFVLTLIQGAHAIIRHRTLKFLVIGFTLSSVAVSLAVELNPANCLFPLDTALKLVCLSILVVMTLARTLGPGAFTGYRVIGGIAGYLLIGFTWAYAYQLVIQQIPDAIRSDADTPAAARVYPGPLIYFSFVTLSTVGYGDLRPIHPIARSLAITEALTGQLYLAILMASLVGISVEKMSARIAGPPDHSPDG